MALFRNLDERVDPVPPLESSLVEQVSTVNWDDEMRKKVFLTCLVRVALALMVPPCLLISAG